MHIGINRLIKCYLLGNYINGTIVPLLSFLFYVPYYYFNNMFIIIFYLESYCVTFKFKDF